MPLIVGATFVIIIVVVVWWRGRVMRKREESFPRIARDLGFSCEDEGGSVGPDESHTLGPEIQLTEDDPADRVWYMRAARNRGHFSFLTDWWEPVVRGEIDHVPIVGYYYRCEYGGQDAFVLHAGLPYEGPAVVLTREREARRDGFMHFGRVNTFDAGPWIPYEEEPEISRAFVDHEVAAFLRESSTGGPRRARPFHFELVPSSVSLSVACLPDSKEELQRHLDVLLRFQHLIVARTAA